MAISDKLTYLNETKTKLKTAINNLGGAIASSDTFRSYVNVLDNIYKYLPKVSGEDTIINLDSTIGAKMEFQLKGNTSQSGTPTPASPIEVNVVTGNNTITINNKNFITSFAKISSSANQILFNNASGYEDYIFKAGTYTFSYKDTNNCNLYMRTATTSNTNLGTAKTITITSAEDFNIWLYRSGITLDELSEIQLELGTTATDYVEHKEQTYEINLGKNLFDKNNAYTSGNTNQDIALQLTNLKVGTKYKFYANEKPWLKILVYDSNNNLKRTLGNTSSTKEIEFIPRDSETIFYFSFYAQNNVDISTYDFTNVYIYEYTYELCKIRDYQDYIFKNNGKWYLHKVTSKIRLDGTEDWQIKHSGTANYYYSALLTSKLLPAEVNYVYYLSNYYVSLSKVSSSDTDDGFKLLPEGYIRIRDGSELSVADFKTYLANNDVLLYSPITNGTDTEITDTELIEQLEALNSSYSYTEQTNISQENSDLPIIIYASTLMGNVEA